jgi:hypothetical protein
MQQMLTKTEKETLESIHVASENDPENPEFPADNPKFPATDTYQIQVPGFSNVWLKDESQNPTGTHKDRMAWEMIVTYRDFLLAKERGELENLPALSIISSGSAANAIQTQLARYGLPPLRVLIDNTFSAEVAAYLEKIGCILYRTNLAAKALTSHEILALTDNVRGFDITSNEALDPATRFYDWLSYEIINSSPNYCFVPFGSGHLYENILNIAKREITTSTHDPRFLGDTKKVQSCNFIGATTNNPNSKAQKLYSPHLPFVHFDEQWIRFYRHAGYCGSQSDVRLLDERYLDEAIELSESQGIAVEPSGIAGLGMLLQMREQIPVEAKVVIVSTGKTKYSI